MKTYQITGSDNREQMILNPTLGNRRDSLLYDFLAKLRNRLLDKLMFTALIRWNPTERMCPICWWSRIETILDASAPVGVKVEPVVQKLHQENMKLLNQA